MLVLIVGVIACDKVGLFVDGSCSIKTLKKLKRSNVNRYMRLSFIIE